MPSSIASIVFISASLLISSTPLATSSSALIDKVCASGKLISVATCRKALESEPRVASAKDLYELSIETIKSGITKSSATLDHIKTLLKDNGADPALGKCKGSYEWVIVSLNSALGEVGMKEYLTATYDLLLVGSVCIRNCEEVVASKAIKDEIIVQGNQLVKVFGSSAYAAVNLL
ncbi:plant invertase/pectin methylesterase inhibitor [Salvia divinorum]|uniref:Plant invertase/pectin methylesterase inhibitor n=1 Tax=Salvia divinorum TaxID=28513 RepID=A0ABD1H4A0_SALDI